jgi:hypothetical protein
MEATERLLAARNSGKRDAVAAAEQELAAVRAEREESDARAGVPPVPAAVSAAAPVKPAP